MLGEVGESDHVEATSVNPRLSSEEKRTFRFRFAEWRPGRLIVAVIKAPAYSRVTLPTPQDTMQINFVRLDRGLPAPSPAHIGDAAVDLHSRIDIVLAPGERAPIPTGIAVAIPQGHAGLVLPRSGHARRHGVGVVNGPGLIDSGYRGEVTVLLINHGEDDVEFARGDRIAQLAIVPVPEVRWAEVDVLDETDRGEGGFGSTGQ
jgi:dUTP pyrophosphatase